MASICSGVAAPPTAASPMTTRRMVEWPTRKPAFTPRRAVDAVEPLAEGVPVPRGARLQRVEGHAFDGGHHAHHVVDVLVGNRRDGEAAVAADHGGDAVERRRRDSGVPQDLRVVVGVDVDEAGGDDEAVGVDHPRGVSDGVGDRVTEHDASVTDADVAPVTRRAGAVDDLGAAQEHVERAGHLRHHPRSLRPCSSPRQCSRTEAPRRRLPPSCRRRRPGSGG